jgi:hypothetical protein
MNSLLRFIDAIGAFGIRHEPFSSLLEMVVGLAVFACCYRSAKRSWKACRLSVDLIAEIVGLGGFLFGLLTLVSLAAGRKG